MSRPTKTIKLSGCEVEIIAYLTWGEKEDLQSVLFKGAKLNAGATHESAQMDFDPSVMVDAKYKLLELAVKEIREGEKKFSYTKEWMNNLSVEDGDLLYSAVDDLSKKTIDRLRLRRQLEGRERLSEMALMEVLSEKYGWLPSQIRNEKMEDINEYVNIISVKKQIEKSEEKKRRNNYGR